MNVTVSDLPEIPSNIHVIALALHVEPDTQFNKQHDGSEQVETRAVSQENYNEAVFLLCIASIGLISNIVVVICVLINRNLRKSASAFVIHGCILDAVRCLYCVPFAVSLLWDMAPGFCAALGGSYVVVVTASGFNIVAMVCCEAYVFSERNYGVENASNSSGENGNFCCVAFGVLMVYATSLIIHLGPTIIGGDFNYNDLIGNCIFVYGTMKSYVAQTMWIVITTLSMIGTVYYLIYFHKHVQTHSNHRLASLVRASIVVSQGNVDETDHLTAQLVFQQTLARCRVLIIITVVFILSWYPLYILTLSDPKFQQPSKIYKLLTFIAWSNAAINPIIFVLFDQGIDVVRRCCDCIVPGNNRSSRSPDNITLTSTNANEFASDQLIGQVTSNIDQLIQNKRVGSRLFQEGQTRNKPVQPVQCNGGRWLQMSRERHCV
ncbi:hypothetical protein HELRODRAFT_185325 [Helobdella robusta]|uniref:G-protein coupled receptors family 1 profile domain-containing protein n=1 Tax=Helobdella robusta TaxID=6412 RepID=T1FMP0_HELRO|nr:hypothetical protein HELRODRAFT_185325 [Helobdella robusta]ESO10252.1 hypothetical protein HELRODRAFT_185325 [Helobdella robusta]